MSNLSISNIVHRTPTLQNREALAEIISDTMMEQAHATISQWAGYTASPLHTLPAFAQTCNVADVFYKDESERFGLASFKGLGAAYVVHQQCQQQAQKGHSVADFIVASATDGNHGRSLAWGAQQAGCQAKIFVHAEVSHNRVKAIAQYGAEVIRIDGNYDESVRQCAKQAAENGWLVISDTSWRGYTDLPKIVMAGYTVLAQELAAQINKPPTHVFLQAGVGSFAGAMIIGLWRTFGTLPKIIIVESDLTPCLLESARNDTLTSVDIRAETIMAGLSCGEPSLLGWQILSQTASHFMTIPDTAVGAFMRDFASGVFGKKIIAGECAVAGAIGLQATSDNAQWREKLGLEQSSRVLLFGSEGMTDETIYNELIATAQ